MKVAAIDVGTNSVKMCVGEKTAEGKIQIVGETSVNARLGEGFDASRRLQPEAMARALAAIRSQVQTARKLGGQRLRMVGTSALRDSANRGEFVNQIYHELGFRLEIISEYDEARLSYNGVDLDSELGGYSGRQLVVDIGGGSTEFIYGENGKMGLAVSVKAGAVRLTEQYFKEEKQTPEELAEAGKMVDKLFRGVTKLARPERLVGVGGSIVNLARVCYKVTPKRTDVVHGKRLSVVEVRGMIEDLLSKSPEERKSLVGLEPERADIILAGGVILDRILGSFEMEEVVVSTKSLRHGLVYEMLSHV